jgi:hypothetical protein
MEMDVDAYLRRRYESQIADIKIVEKEDLDLVRILCFSYTTLALIICFLGFYRVIPSRV